MRAAPFTKHCSNEDFAMDKKRGDDAQDHAPQPQQPKSAVPGDKQDARNYEERQDEAGAIEVENMSSANDEGAN